MTAAREFLEDHPIVAAILIGVGGIVAFMYGIMFIGERLSLPGSLARIEQLRTDVRGIGAAESEDVIGQVTKWNQTIASNKRYNATWWAAPIVPNEWDSVQPIGLPDRSRP